MVRQASTSGTVHRNTGSQAKGAVVNRPQKSGRSIRGTEAKVKPSAQKKLG